MSQKQPKDDLAATFAGGRDESSSPLKSVPLIGEALDNIAFGRGSARALMHENLADFTTELRQSLDLIEQRTIDLKVIDDEGFIDVFAEMFPKIIRTISKKKRSRFKSILLNMLQGKPQPDFSKLYLNILYEMTDLEMEIFAEFCRLYKTVQEHRANGETVDFGPFKEGPIFGIELPVFRQIAQSLIRQGLLRDDSQGRYGTPAYSFLEPTELGIGFCEYVATDQPQAARSKV